MCDDQVTYWARAARMHCLHAGDVLRKGARVLLTLGVDVPCNRYIMQSHRTLALQICAQRLSCSRSSRCSKGGFPANLNFMQSAVMHGFVKSLLQAMMFRKSCIYRVEEQSKGDHKVAYMYPSKRNTCVHIVASISTKRILEQQLVIDMHSSTQSSCNNTPCHIVSAAS